MQLHKGIGRCSHIGVVSWLNDLHPIGRYIMDFRNLDAHSKKPSISCHDVAARSDLINPHIFL